MIKPIARAKVLAVERMGISMAIERSTNSMMKRGMIVWRVPWPDSFKLFISLIADKDCSSVVCLIKGNMKEGRMLTFNYVADDTVKLQISVLFFNTGPSCKGADKQGRSIVILIFYDIG